MSESYARSGYSGSEGGYDEPDGYAQRGYDEPERGYAQRGYDEPEREYAPRGYSRRGYDEPEREYAPRGYSRRGYDEPERGYARRGNPERGDARGKQKSTRTGAVIVTAVALFSTFLVLWGLYYATGTTERHKAALAAAGCEPNLTSNNLPCVTVQQLVASYAAFSKPDLQQLNADVADYTSNESHNLAAAKVALNAEVATADALTRSLTKFPFPAFAAPAAKVTIAAVQARVKLMTEQAQSSSLAELRSFDARVNASSAAIQTDLARLSKAVAHHPSPSQEPATVVGG